MAHQKNNEIIRLILALAHTLNLETVAEGVETPEQIVELKKLGCFIDGIHFLARRHAGRGGGIDPQCAEVPDG